MLEDVTLIKGADVAVHVRFKGGTTSSFTLPRAKASWEERQTRQEVVALVDRLLDEHTDGEAAAILNARGLVSGALPNSDSSVSVHPLKLTTYPPNGTLFGGTFGFPFASAFAIVSPSS
jgi:hypothetical protein